MHKLQSQCVQNVIIHDIYAGFLNFDSVALQYFAVPNLMFVSVMTLSYYFVHYLYRLQKLVFLLNHNMLANFSLKSYLVMHLTKLRDT